MLSKIRQNNQADTSQLSIDRLGKSSVEQQVDSYNLIPLPPQLEHPPSKHPLFNTSRGTVGKKTPPPPPPPPAGIPPPKR